MNKVSVCLVLNSDYYGTIHSFESSGFSVIEDKKEFITKDAPKEYLNVIGEVEVELLVAVTPSTDRRLIDYFTPIASALHEYYEPTNLGEIYNNLFRKASHDFVCIFNPYIFLQQHWLQELIYYHQLIQNSGVVSICDDTNKVDFEPLPCKDLEVFTNVFVPKNDLIDYRGVCLFWRQHLYLIGAFDENKLLFGGDHLNQFQLRCIAKEKLKNFYIPSQSCIMLRKWIEVSETILEPSKNYVISSLAEMKKAKNYYIPL